MENCSTATARHRKIEKVVNEASAVSVDCDLCDSGGEVVTLSGHAVTVCENPIVWNGGGTRFKIHVVIVNSQW